MESSILLSLILHVHIYIVVCPLKHILHKGGSDENKTEGLSGEKVELDSTCAYLSIWKLCMAYAMRLYKADSHGYSFWANAPINVSHWIWGT